MAHDSSEYRQLVSQIMDNTSLFSQGGLWHIVLDLVNIVKNYHEISATVSLQNHFFCWSLFFHADNLNLMLISCVYPRFLNPWCFITCQHLIHHYFTSWYLYRSVNIIDNFWIVFMMCYSNNQWEWLTFIWFLEGNQYSKYICTSIKELCNGKSKWKYIKHFLVLV